MTCSPSRCFRAASCAIARWLHSWRSPVAVLPRLLPSVSFRQFCLGDGTSLESLPAISCDSYDMLRGIVNRDFPHLGSRCKRRRYPNHLVVTGAPDLLLNACLVAVYARLKAITQRVCAPEFVFAQGVYTVL